MFLNCKLNLEEHLKTIVNKINKTIGLLCKFQNFLPRKLLLTIYKSFIRAHLDYDDIIYDQSYNTSFHQRLKLLQYNTALPITDAIRGTSMSIFRKCILSFIRPFPNSFEFSQSTRTQTLDKVVTRSQSSTLS